MKEVLVFLMILCLLPMAQGLGESPGALETTMPTAMPGVATVPDAFDEGIRKWTCAPYGNRVDFAQISEEALRRGFAGGHGYACLVGQRADHLDQVLTDDLPQEIIPAGDAFIYYGKDPKGEFGWVIRKPGEEPKRLNLGITDEVFYADAERIWYSTVMGEEIAIRCLIRKGYEKKGFGKTRGWVVSMMEDGGLLIFNRFTNLVQHWQNRKSTPLYQPEEPITGVVTVGKSIFVSHEQEFGLLEDGRLAWRLAGRIQDMVATSDQSILLVAHPNSPDLEMLLFNDTYQAYAWLGAVKASDQLFVELLPGNRVSVWMEGESYLFEMPLVDQWRPYGEPLGDSRQETPSVTATPEPDWDSVVGIIVPNRWWQNDVILHRILDHHKDLYVYSTENRDDSCSFMFTPVQQQEWLALLDAALRNEIGQAMAGELSRAIKGYTCSDNFDELSLEISESALQDEAFLRFVGFIGRAAPLVQLFEGEVEEPVSTIRLLEHGTGRVLATYRAPEDLWNAGDVEGEEGTTSMPDADSLVEEGC